VSSGYSKIFKIITVRLITDDDKYRAVFQSKVSDLNLIYLEEISRCEIMYNTTHRIPEFNHESNVF